MLNGKVILVVDDDITLMEMYVERLKMDGAIILQAKDGEEALARVTEGKPACILLDIMMPKIDGLTVLKKLKEDSETAKIPVIVLSALADDQKKKEAKDLGAADYFVKSEMLPADVLARVSRLIGVEKLQGK